MTEFQKVYDCFLGKITDDMYLEWTEEDTLKDIESIFFNSIPNFEFPRFRLYSYNEEKTAFEDNLTEEEINILALLMVKTWLDRQIASVENIRMKYSGSDFKMTSQANHLSKLLDLKEEIQKENKRLQRLYKRRKLENNGQISSNWSLLIKERVIK